MKTRRLVSRRLRHRQRQLLISCPTWRHLRRLFLKLSLYHEYGPSKLLPVMRMLPLRAATAGMRRRGCRSCASRRGRRGGLLRRIDCIHVHRPLVARSNALASSYVPLFSVVTPRAPAMAFLTFAANRAGSRCSSALGVYGGSTVTSATLSGRERTRMRCRTSVGNRFAHAARVGLRRHNHAGLSGPARSRMATGSTGWPATNPPLLN